MEEQTYGVGIVGFGFIGKVHAYSYLNLPLFYSHVPGRFPIVGVATAHAATATQVASVVPVQFTTTDWHELIARDDIKIINICSPNANHLPVLIAAIKAGKHIYCDKPLVCDATEARNVLELLSDYQGTSQMALQYRFLPATLRARQLVEAGFLGKVSTFRCAYLHSGYVDPSRPFSWRLDKSQSGGGALYDLGAHILDLTEHLAGPIASVCCTCETFTRSRPLPDGAGMAEVNVDDHAVVLARTENGAVGVVEASRVATGANDDLRFEIHGSQGALRFSLMDPNWLEAYDNRAEGEPIGGTKGWTRIECVQRYPAPAGFPGPKFSVGWIRAHMAAIYNFVSAVAAGQPTSPDLARGAQLQLLLDRCYASAQTGRWLDVHGVKDDPAAGVASQPC